MFMCQLSPVSHVWLLTEPMIPVAPTPPPHPTTNAEQVSLIQRADQPINLSKTYAVMICKRTVGLNLSYMSAQNAMAHRVREEQSLWFTGGQTQGME